MRLVIQKYGSYFVEKKSKLRIALKWREVRSKKIHFRSPKMMGGGGGHHNGQPVNHSGIYTVTPILVWCSDFVAWFSMEKYILVEYSSLGILITGNTHLWEYSINLGKSGDKNNLEPFLFKIYLAHIIQSQRHLGLCWFALFHVMLFRSTRLLSQRIHLVVSVDLSVKKIGTPTRLCVGYGIICVGVSCACWVLYEIHCFWLGGFRRLTWRFVYCYRRLTRWFAYWKLSTLRGTSSGNVSLFA